MISKFLFFVSLVFFSVALWAQSNVEKRLSDLEKGQVELERRQTENYLRTLDRQGHVRTFLGDAISFGGFFESALTHLDGDDMSTQTSANSNILGLNIAATFSEEIRFVSQFLTGLSYPLQNPHNNPAVTPSQRQFEGIVYGSLVAQAYVELRKSDLFKIQAGLGYVPFGHSLQLREPVLFRRRGGPQLASTGSANSVGVVFPLWMGVHVLGSGPIADGRWGYNAYTFSPSTKKGTLGGGGRLWWAPSEIVTGGVSFQTGEEGNGDQYYAYGVDANVKVQNYGVVIEYAKNEVGSTGGLKDPESYYVEPYMSFKKGEYLIFAAADYLDSPNNTTLLVPDAFEKVILGAGVNWLPNQNTRLRLGYLNHHYLGSTATIAGQERDYSSIDLSAAIAF